MKAIFSSARHHFMAGLSIFLVVASLMAGLAGCDTLPDVNFIEIHNWYDLYAIGNNMSANYALENDLDATTDGWEELASPTANEGKGWKPIAGLNGSQPEYFTGIFDGKTHEIRDLFIDRPDEDRVGLFAWTGGMIAGISGSIRNVGVTNATVTGREEVGGLAGRVMGVGAVEESYFTGTVTGEHQVGGLIGRAAMTVENCHFIGTVTGDTDNEFGMVGGLAGISYTTMKECDATGDVTGGSAVGGLIGENQGTGRRLYFTGTVAGNYRVGGLAGMGISSHKMIDCYAAGDVTGDERAGGLIGENQGTVSGSYFTGTVTGSHGVGGLAGISSNHTSNCYATGDVTGHSWVGGLIGENQGTVSDSYSTASVSGNMSVGGLIGLNNLGTVTNCFWDTETSGQPTSDGGTGKNTMEMKDIVTFTDTDTEGLDEPWDIVTVANPDTRVQSFIWNIVNGVTYPFLSWQPVA